MLDHGFAISDRITKAMPADVMGKGVALKDIFDPQHKRYNDGGEFRALYDQDADVRTIYETAVGLEGQIRNWGVHAAGVIMSSEPLIDIVPIMSRPQDGAVITQFDYPMCESLGLVKMDFLGLSNLRILEDALSNIQVNRDETVVLEELPFDDRATYELMGRGDTLGVFQLDGSGMRALLRSMQPDQFADITAVSALYRPGPMGADSHNKYARRKNGREPIEPIHPALAEALEPVLGETYGLIVYQEQVMAIAQVLAGFTLGAADNLRRAMGKKKKEELDKQYAGFQAGMLERGFPQNAIDKLWEILLPFSDYAFNKSHSAAYGVITYWTAYLKANYPTEYMAALLTSVKDDKDKMAIYLNECRRMKIQVLPPDVNESHANFTPVGTDIRFGLTAVRNVGSNVVDGIVAAREEKGRYADFNDFMEKVPALVCNKRVVESLIKAGAFDDMKHKRRALVAMHETAVDQFVDLKKNEAIGQDSLFGGLSEDDAGFGVSVTIPDIDDWDKMTLLGPRARDAGPLRLRPPAARPRARALAGHRLHHRPADARRGPAARLDPHRQRADHLRGAQDHQARRPVGHHHARGPRRRHRRAALPELLHAGLDAARRGRDRADQGPAVARQGPARAARAGGDGARPHPGPGRPGRDQPAVHPLHTARRGPAARRARHPPGHDRGAAAPADPQLDQGAPPRRQPARQPEPRALRRPQAAPRPGVPDRMSRCAPVGRRRAWRSRSPAPLAGVLWEWLWDAPPGLTYQGQWFLEPAGPDVAFEGVALFVADRLPARAAPRRGSPALRRGHEVSTVVVVLLGRVRSPRS